MYHHIGGDGPPPDDERARRYSVPRARFAEQLDYLGRAGYTYVTLDDLAAALNGGSPLPPKPVILTFDDGYDDFYSLAFPLLQEHNAKATIYVISGRVGEGLHMGWDTLRKLATSPLITIGAHSRTHPQLEKASPQRMRDELAGSKSDIEAQLGLPVRHFAYPNGSYSPAVVEQARAAGYLTATTVRGGTKAQRDRLLELPRVFVKGDDTLQDLIKQLP
jgi:peptidoglycan/xylan/chitin deacetylase (PgdA/CDA1 family)